MLAGFRARVFLTGALALVTLWLGGSALAVHHLTGRPKARFVEPLPAKLWTKLEETRLRTSDGHDIGAWFADGRSNAPTLILLHGNKGSRWNSLRQAELLSSKGYAFLLPSLRCHGDSSGEYHDIGFSARQDLIAAVSYVEQQRPGRPIIVVGISLGAATACFASKELGNRVRGYVLESSYQDLKTAVWNRTKNYLPTLIHQVAYAGLRLVGSFYLPHLDEISPLKAIEGIPEEVPILILAADADPLVRRFESEALFDRVKTHARLVFFPASEHVPMLRVEQARYLKELNGFCDRISTPVMTITPSTK